MAMKDSFEVIISNPLCFPSSLDCITSLLLVISHLPQHGFFHSSCGFFELAGFFPGQWTFFFAGPVRGEKFNQGKNLGFLDRDGIQGRPWPKVQRCLKLHRFSNDDSSSKLRPSHFFFFICLPTFVKLGSWGEFWKLWIQLDPAITDVKGQTKCFY